MSRLRNVILTICILTLFACARTKIRMDERETAIEKESVFEKGSGIEKNASERSHSGKGPAEKVATPKPFRGRDYVEAISDWKSHLDLVKWMEEVFSFDAKRYKKYEGTLPVPRTPEETFQLKAGIYIDAAFFLKETLNRIDPQYGPRVVILMTRPPRFNHYVCSFKKDGKLFIMDYGTPYKEITGTHGPYNSLEEYRKFYEKAHPAKRKIEAIRYLQ